ncbi:MAG: CHASE4 domain-containing protein, partial [Pseudomonadota bacterium]
MSLRFKALSAIMLTLIILVSGVYFVTYKTIMLGLVQIETNYAKKDIQRIHDAIDNEINALNVKFLDWSSWDDTVKFMHTKNPQYIKSNLSDTPLLGMKINFFVLLDNSKKLAFGRMVNIKEQKVSSLDSNFLGELAQTETLYYFKNPTDTISGLVHIEKRHYLVTSQKILSTERKGDSPGVLLVGIAVDEEFIKKMAVITHLGLTFNSQQEKNNVDILERINSQTLLGYTRFHDLQGNSIFNLRLEIQRDIFQQGKQIRSGVFWVMLLGMLVLGGLVFIIVEFSLISRIMLLKNWVEKIEFTNNLSLRIPVYGRDEMSSLAISINKMLTALEKSKKSLSLLLDNSGQGFFSFDARGIVGPEFSKATEDFWQQNPAGCEIEKLFNKNEESIKANLKLIFERIIPFEESVSLLPKTLRLKNRLIQLQYREIKGQDTRPLSVMVLATDSTEIYRLQDLQEKERLQHRSIIKILNAKNDFIDTLELSDRLDQASGNLLELQRHLHTLKGELSFFECLELVEICQQWENKLKNDGSIHEQRSATLEISKKIKEFLDDNKATLKIRHLNRKNANIPIAQVNSLALWAHEKGYPEVSEEIENLLKRPTEECLAFLSHNFIATAEKLGKKASPIIWTGMVSINPYVYKDLFKSLVHLTRNAADHGLADDTLRLEKMILSLKQDPAQAAALDKYLKNLHDPASPN